MRSFLLVSLVLLCLTGRQDMPVARLSGGAQGPAGLPLAQAPRVLDELPPLPATQIDPRVVTLDSPRRLTLTFAEARPIHEVLTLVTAGTPFSITIDSDATGSFRGELKELTLREALATILTPLALDYDVERTVIRVHRRQMQTRIFDLDLLHVQRALTRTGGDARTAVTTALAPDDVLNSVADAVKALLSDHGTVHVDKRAGLVQVTDFSDRLDRIALYVDTLHQRSGRQIRLHAEAYEVTLFGGTAIDWGALRERLGLRRDASEAATAIDSAALLSALSAQGEVRVLWTPDVTVLNNEPASIRLVTTGASSLSLTVVPQISANGIVQLSVAHALEEHAADKRTRLAEADTVMRILDGKTALITGLLRPVDVSLRSTSRIGAMFGSSSKHTTHAELVVLLRPTIVSPGTAVVTGTRD